MGIKQFIFKHFIENNYLISKKLFWRELNKRRGVKTINVFIYTMGKVGSTSIYDSLKNISNKVFCMHFHRLGKDYLKNREIKVKSELFGNPIYSQHLYTSLLWKPQWVRKKFIEKTINPVKFITIIREPVSRNIYLFFQINDL